MIINFRIRGISRAACILAQTPANKKKEIDTNHKTSVPWLIMEMLRYMVLYCSNFSNKHRRIKKRIQLQTISPCTILHHLEDFNGHLHHNACASTLCCWQFLRCISLEEIIVTKIYNLEGCSLTGQVLDLFSKDH